MAALQALVGDLTPPNEDIELLQQVGILPSTSSSTTTNPYTSGGNPLDPSTGTESTGVLQAIQKLDEKMTGGFAQIMAKLSNTPIKGGGEIKSPQSIEMSVPSVNSTVTQAPSFFNKLKSGVGSAVSGMGSAVTGMGSALGEAVGMAPATAPAAATPAAAPVAAPVAPAEAARVGGATKMGNKNKNNKNKNKTKNSKSSSTNTLQNPMTHITQMGSTSSLAGGRRRKTRKSRHKRRHSRRH
jgi:hypothetical protein